MIGQPFRMEKPPTAKNRPAQRLILSTLLTAVLWAAGMSLCWMVGIEPIYAHPAPFYALWYPVGIRGLLTGGMVLVLWSVAAAGVRRLIPPAMPRYARAPFQGLLALMALLIGFALLTASVRGVSGIWQAYNREAYEVIGDIGKAPSISTFFRRYSEIHPWLSMHGKVHPPGPAALLWLFSYVTGRSAPALALATLVFGSLCVPAMWLWCRRTANAPTARVASLLITCVPAVVLFGAVSADFLFLPMTLTTLWLFHEAIDRRGHPLWSAVAGLGYALMALMKYSLPAVGVWFGVVGLILLRRPGGWRAVSRCAVIMAATAGGALLLVRGLMGFNYLEGFVQAAAQFRLDQHHLDRLTPRYPGWTFRLLFNPLTFFYFAGFPVSLLALACVFRLRRRILCAARPVPLRLPGRTSLALTFRETVLACLITVCALNLLYLGRGEGERSALYLFPFLILPAARLMAAVRYRSGSDALLAAAMTLMAAQTVITEILFYTYW